MRIISKFHDYYDLGMQYGQDNTIVWVRNTEEIKVKDLDRDTFHKLPKLSFHTNYKIKTSRYECAVELVYLAFCGKWQRLYIGTVTKHYYPYKAQTLCSENIETLRDRFIRLVDEELKRDGDKYSGRYNKHSEKHIEQSAHEIHRHFNSPVILYSNGLVIKNPNLKSIGYNQIKDPYTVYQNISMYMSGVLGQPANPTVTLSDKSKVLKHGFDAKWSFRRRPK